MRPAELIQNLESRGFTFEPNFEEGTLLVKPKGKLEQEDKVQITTHKQSILDVLAGAPLPELNPDGSVRIPFDAVRFYRWWSGDGDAVQSLYATLVELEAGVQSWRLYSQPQTDLLTEAHRERCKKGVPVDAGDFWYCLGCNYFCEKERLHDSN